MKASVTLMPCPGKYTQRIMYRLNNEPGDYTTLHLWVDGRKWHKITDGSQAIITTKEAVTLLRTQGAKRIIVNLPKMPMNAELLYIEPAKP